MIAIGALLALNGCAPEDEGPAADFDLQVTMRVDGVERTSIDKCAGDSWMSEAGYPLALGIEPLSAGEYLVSLSPSTEGGERTGDPVFEVVVTRDDAIRANTERLVYRVAYEGKRFEVTVQPQNLVHCDDYIEPRR